MTEVETHLPREQLAGQIESELCQFSGTTQWFQHWLGITYTDGVAHLAERCGAYWLIDAVASHYVTNPKLQREEFLIVRLVVDRPKKWTHMATLSLHSDWETSDPRKYPAIAMQRIEYTDFPLDSIKLYLCDNVLMLPSEY